MSIEIISPQIASSIPAFLCKTKSILKNPEYQGIIEWDKEGKIIKILNMKQMERIILPKEFRHCNYNSFVRQLNMYGFKKMKKRLYGIAFSHPFFLRDQAQQAMLSIKRRKNIFKKDKSHEAQFNTCSSLEKINELFSQKNIGISVNRSENNFNINQLYFSQQLKDSSLYYQSFGRQGQIPYQWTIPYYSSMII